MSSSSFAGPSNSSRTRNFKDKNENQGQNQKEKNSEDLGRDSIGEEYGFGRENQNQEEEEREEEDENEEDENNDEDEEETLTMKLIRVWSNERLSPEILHHQEPLLELALDRIHQQSTALEVLLNSPDGLSNDEHFRLTLIETEIEHLRYLCKAYARARMYKLDKFFDHCLIDPETKSRLSQVDLEYCRRERTLVNNLLLGSVLEGLPSKYHRLDEDHMIVRPDLDQGVFISVIKDCGPVYLPNSESIILMKDSKHFLRYRSIKTFLESGHLKLI